MIDQKTIEGLEWITPPKNQGQHVTVSYANDGITVFQRTTYKGISPWASARGARRTIYLCADIDSIWDNPEEWPGEEWEYEPWNREPIVPEFLWKEVVQ